VIIAYSGDVNGRFQRDVNGHSGDMNKVGAQRRWDYNHARHLDINQGGARFIFSIVSFPFLSLFRLCSPDVKPVLSFLPVFFFLVSVVFFSEKCHARIA